ncbi:DUF2784 domain-containing protein [Yinghuangia soli]|uniref:DUF2784 domain-containing protein n=1 Tax=Yinghuangia soli TaxID=2908204 RepID=A0AA41Q794_9ACTN|nr:DUF2784 domain-containing protein [Yinghuangia soli]MCF2532909.1 DUF2784 domain-containing protein [Yinghuangia soli]
MGYRILADAAMTAHFAFLAYVVLGGFAAWRWPRMLWPHLAAALWGLIVITGSIECPLTAAENWARERAGENRMATTGFIDHYIEGVLYPERFTTLLQLLAAACVLASWTVPLHRRRTRKALGPPKTPKPDRPARDRPGFDTAER